MRRQSSASRRANGTNPRRKEKKLDQKNALRLLLVVAVAGVIGLLSLVPVAAQQAGISRSLPAGPVAPGDEFDVTINNVGLADGFGSVVETLPAGFSYVDGSATSVHCQCGYST